MRPIIIRFRSRAERDAVWLNAKESEFHKAKGLRFGKDLTNKDRETRMELWPQIEAALKRGWKAFFIGPKAIINGKEVRLNKDK